MILSARDRRNLEGVHPDLIRVIEQTAARTFLNWFVNEGVRAPERQKALRAAGRTLTLKSAHLARPVVIDGVVREVGLAVDLVLVDKKGAIWVFDRYFALAAEILEAAARMRVPMRWGGHFRNRRGERFADGLHFELDRDFYT